ncbi:major facilitator superfamily domain-containing protein 4A-like isoform X3 [Plectropomus leopardus]|uniref:major facilitator superfamily domain-containing protein 4A-like isoform X3 n=1 Tax=Plectropomus leopardus TaxID=160734 RepID=UPI001C4D0F23|nr:major facilitator superfamily domain-containing protein 4A-like isoform X3 [Plectropomus leopardus]
MKLLDERMWTLFKRHWQQTLTYWSVFFSFGLCIAFLGPTVLDLRCQTQSTLQQITWVFFSQQLFLLGGSSLGGLFKKTLLSSLSALFSCTLIISLVFSFIPLCNHVVLLSVAMAIAGLAMGVIDTIANLQLVKLYQKDSATFLQLPVPAAVLALMYHERLLPCSRSRPRLLERDSLSSVNPAGDSGQGHGSLFGCCNPAKLRGRPATFYIVHALGGAILFITDGIIGSYTGFVYTYAVSPPLLMGHKTAGSLDSVFWASITVGRLALIYLSYRYTAQRLLIFSLVGVILVQCLLLIFYTSCVFLFIGTCVLGLCISSVFPSMLAFTEDILDYKGCATTVLVTSASTGEMMLQLLVGLVIHSQGSYSFLLCCTIASFIGFCLFLMFLYVQRRHTNCHTGKHTEHSSENTDMKEKPETGAS